MDGVVAPALISVASAKEIAITILSALEIWYVALTIVVLTFQQALTVASFLRETGIDGYTRCWCFFLFITFPTSFRQCVIFNLLFV